MKKRIASILGLAASFIFVSFLLAGCIGGIGGNGTQGGSTGTESETKAGLPTTFSSNGNNYTITDFTISEDEEGNTVVSCEGSGFDVIPMRNNTWIIPVYCSVIENGQETEFVSVSTGKESIDFLFDKKLDPETVVFYPEDAKDDRTEIAVR